MAGQELTLAAAPIRFSSGEVPSHALVEFLHDYYGQAAVRMQVELLGSSPPMVELEALPLEGVVLGKGAIGGLALTRTAQLVSADGNDSLLLIASDSAFHGRFQNQSEYTQVAAGSLLVASYGAASAQVNWAGTNRIRSLQLDSQRLAKVLPRFDPEAMQGVFARHEAGLLFRYTKLLQESDLGDPEVIRLATDHLFDLTALVLGARGDVAAFARENGVRAARLASIKDDVRRRFGEPDLSVGELARSHGISVRYLQTLFEQAGVTYSEFLARQRLEFAAARLRDTRYRHLRIADIAFDAGYSDLTAFNRAFRKYYGETPSRMRTG